ncbi:MAG: prepilin-type N-terminal cleavage/methylation domain-containing protein [Arenicellales bacterium]
MSGRRALRRTVRPDTSGFTLIELAIALVVLGLLAMLAVDLLPKLTDRIRLDQTKVDETKVDKAVVGFALAHNRLPCPDTNNNGQEGGASGTCAAGDVVGTLPYRSMGLPGPALDEARLPLRYGVYRDSADGADLAALTELFEPALPDKLTITAGTASQCNQMSDTPVTTVTYYKPPATTLRVHQTSGTFKKGDVIGYTNIGYDNLSIDTPPSPPSGVQTSTTLPDCPSAFTNSPGFSVCPCGNTGGAGSSCAQCSSGFGLGNSLTSDTGSDVPYLYKIISNTTSSSTSGTLVGFPGNGAAVGSNPGFNVGDTIYELYSPDQSDYSSTTFLFSVSPPCFGNVATCAYQYSTGSPATYPCHPTRTLTVPNSTAMVQTPDLLTGVSATVTSVQSNQAHVAGDPIHIAGDIYDLPIDQFPTYTDPSQPNYGDPTDPFSAGDTIYASPSDAVGTVVSETTQHLMFQDGDTVYAYANGDTSNPPSGTGTISNVTPYSFQWNALTGSISDGNLSITTTSSGTHASGTKPDAIVDQNTGATGTVAKVETGYVLLQPGITRGSISFAATTVQYTNELDFCQAIRNAIAATEPSPGSSGGVHTVNQDQGGILVNPAYLLVSGGVEDANGNGNGLSDFDLRNELSPSVLDFESPGRLRNSSSNAALAYDDVVSTLQMKVLAERLRCARNIGAVNALAADATVERNLEEMAFEQNEQALTNIQLTYAALQLADWDVAIAAVELTASAVETAIAFYKLTNEDPAEAAIADAISSVLDAVAGTGSLLDAVGELVVAINAQKNAQDDYAGACTAQYDPGPPPTGTGPALTTAIDAANTALDLAIRADAWGGVH